jgi:hypothetical protein
MHFVNLDRSFSRGMIAEQGPAAWLRDRSQASLLTLVAVQSRTKQYQEFTNSLVVCKENPGKEI